MYKIVIPLTNIKLAYISRRVNLIVTLKEMFQGACRQPGIIREKCGHIKEEVTQEVLVTQKLGTANGEVEYQTIRWISSS